MSFTGSRPRPGKALGASGASSPAGAGPTFVLPVKPPAVVPPPHELSPPHDEEPVTQNLLMDSLAGTGDSESEGGRTQNTGPWSPGRGAAGGGSGEKVGGGENLQSHEQQVSLGCRGGVLAAPLLLRPLERAPTGPPARALLTASPWRSPHSLHHHT